MGFYVFLHEEVLLDYDVFWSADEASSAIQIWGSFFFCDMAKKLISVADNIKCAEILTKHTHTGLSAT